MKEGVFRTGSVWNAAKTGTLLAISLLMSTQAAAEEKKTPVSFNELPANIKAAVIEALPNGKIVSIEQEVEGEDPGQYDFVIEADGKTYEVEITPEGEVNEVKAIGGGGKSAEKRWAKNFGLEDRTFTSTGKNRFFILEPGYRLVLESEKEKVVITVLDETETVGGIETRVVEEREEQGGKLKEVSRNFFAICKRSGDVFYFGEEVDIYEDGKIVKHSGAWRADEPDSHAGIIMPGTTLLGARHYQEIAPDAMDRAEILSDDETFQAPAGQFKHCLKVEETSAVEAGVCYKTYAPEVGLIQDEDLLLTKYGYVGK